MSISNQYYGKLSSKDVAQGMNLAIKNSQRLLKDAEILFNNKRFSSSTALSILNIEEAGKTSILRGLALEEDQKKIAKEWKAFCNHLQKNNLWILPDLILEGAKTLDELTKIFLEDANHPKILNIVKQLALYTDCVGKAERT